MSGNVLEAVVAAPEQDGAKKKVEGALAVLKDAATGFESDREIGKSFETIHKSVGSALRALLSTQL